MLANARHVGAGPSSSPGWMLSLPGPAMMSSTPIIDDIVALWQVATPVEDIARKLHLPIRSVRHALEFGRLPEPQPRWNQQSIGFEA
ncbi:MAG: hypothetical protein R3C59_14565 [Planctomycetaceae bacterium]